MEILLVLLFTSLMCLSIGSLLLRKNPINQLKLEIFCSYTTFIVLILTLFKTEELYFFVFGILCAIPVGLTIPLKTKRLNRLNKGVL